MAEYRFRRSVSLCTTNILVLTPTLSTDAFSDCTNSWCRLSLLLRGLSNNYHVENLHLNISLFVQTCSGPGSLWSVLTPFQIVTPVVSAGMSAVLGTGSYRAKRTQTTAALIILCYFAWQLYHEFGWAVFRIVGADPQLKDMFRYYQVMIVLLKVCQATKHAR